MTIDLKKFCWSGTSNFRLDLAEPFSDDRYTYASNGQIMIRVARRDDVTHTNATKTAVLSGYVADKIEKITFSPFPDVELPDVPPYVPTPCKTCKGTGRIYSVECRKCKGNGTIECPTCHGSDECEPCKGLGTVDRPAIAEDDPKDVADCDDCAGTGDSGDPDAHVLLFTRVGPYWLDRRYAVMLMALPGIEIDVDHAAWHVGPDGQVGYTRCEPVMFRFDGGVGAVLPLFGKPATAVEAA